MPPLQHPLPGPAEHLVSRDAASHTKDAESALRSLATYRPDLLFTDVLMPGTMDGIGLARDARRLHPGLPALLSSGYAGAPNRVANSGCALISRPFSLEELDAAIQRACSGQRSEAEEAVKRDQASVGESGTVVR